ncbi:MAG: biopolymer transporter ExbD [Verrucomicrobia bacterium]|nr:biopolymer transporter ExbD [Verrucomicrobiota bacterium]
MKFSSQRRKQTPAVIIVALIDILIVLVIFLIVTTTFKQQPAIKLALPESKQQKQGVSETAPLLVTVAKQQPFFYLGPNPITFDKLQETLVTRAKANPEVTMSIRADTDAPFGKIINVMDAAKLAGIKNVSAFTKAPGAKD